MADIIKDTTNNTIGTGTGGLELSPSGTDIVTINNGVLLPDGTKTAPAVRFTDDDNTGIFSPTNEEVAITGNGEMVIHTVGVVSAVNNLKVTNATTGNDVALAAEGTDTDIDIDIQPKGAGVVRAGGTEVMKVGDAPTSHTHDDRYYTETEVDTLLTGYSATSHNHDADYADIAHTHTLDGLSDVVITTPADGHVLTYDSGTGNWVNEAASGGGASALGDLTDVTITAAAKGELLVHNGTAWVDVGVGTNDQVLTADSAQAAGVKWATPAGGGELLFEATGSTAPTASGTSCVAAGESASCLGNYGVAVGWFASVSSGTSRGVALGSSSKALKNYSIGIGYSTAGQAGDNDIYIGYSARTGGSGGNNVALGPYAVAGSGGSSNSVAVGPYVENTSSYSFKAGYSTTNTLHLKDLGRLHLQGAQAAYVAPPYASGAEPTAVEGAIIWDSTNKKLKVYNGTSWETITSS